MKELQPPRDFYPTKPQREKTLDIDSQLLELLNRSRDSDWFVARDIETWARSLHLWMPECGDTEKRESFVRERVNALLRLGVLRRADQVWEDGTRVAGFVIHARRGENGLSSKWSPADRTFLRSCGISPADDTRESVERPARLTNDELVVAVSDIRSAEEKEMPEQLATAHRFEGARNSFGDDSDAVLV